jgi:hypothetical protein
MGVEARAEAEVGAQVTSGQKNLAKCIMTAVARRLPLAVAQQ